MNLPGDEFGFARKRADVGLEGAPATRDFLERNPSMWPCISSSIPSGWDEEVAGTLAALLDLSSKTGVGIRVAQIKSKLAGLRLYVDIDEDFAGPAEIVGQTPISTQLRSSSKSGSVRERATEIIDAAAKACESRCELCGAPGELRNESGWLRIACPAHARLGPNSDKAI